VGLKPDFVLHRISEIPFDWLKKNEIKGILVDLDNTLTSYHSEDIPQDTLTWLYSLIELGIPFLPYSNARRYRIENFCKRFGIDNPGLAIKPLNIGLRRVLRFIKVPGKNLLLIGDQVFTDVLAGKFAGIRTVLVDPVSKTTEFPATKVMRIIERIIGRGRWKYNDLR
jgi:HAD superfamily phosphatase (TIGR01668 family)